MNLKIKQMKNLKMSIVMNKIIINVVLFLAVSCNSYSQNISGIWKFANQYIDIELELKETDNKVEGLHCIIYGAQGDYVDCASKNINTISGELINGTYNLSIRSEYTVDGVVLISLKLVDGKLKWALLSNTNSSELFFYPKEVTLTKEN